jgi:hypothetical protein
MDKVVKAVKPESVVNSGEAAQKAAPRFLEGTPPASDTYPLKFPMEFDGQEYRSVTLSPLKGKHFKKMRLLIGMGVDPDDAILALVTGLPVEVLGELDGDDYTEVAERAVTFIPARFRTGSEPDSETGLDTQA